MKDEPLGALLEARDLEYSLVVVGGGSLLLLGLLQRPTKDLDVVAVAGRTGYEKSAPLPEPLVGARWARQHDPSPGFRESLVQALAAFGVEPGDAGL